MKRVTIVGIGLGDATITPEAGQAIARADVIFGAPRVLDLCRELTNRSYPFYLPKDVAAVIAGMDAQEFAVLVSGDVGFYSTAAGLAETLLLYDLRFVPGISTVSAFFAKLKLPWQDAAFVSAHGRDLNIADVVRRNHMTFCLTGNNANKIGAALIEAGFGQIRVHLGKNLGTEQERLDEITAEQLAQCEYPSLTVLLLLNEAFDDRTPCGLPDSSYMRLPGIPMTKSETRAVVMSKLALQPDSVCWDVGAGTGSVTVEMALNVYRSHVYAVERRQEAIPLIKQNCAAFHVGNVTVICGEAPAVLETLPAPDAVFVGGSGKGLTGIITTIFRKNPDARIVVTAITVETVSAALAAFAKAGLKPEIVQINVARGKQTGKMHLMEAQNPVTILRAEGKHEPVVDCKDK